MYEPSDALAVSCHLFAQPAKCFRSGRFGVAMLHRVAGPIPDPQEVRLTRL